MNPFVYYRHSREFFTYMERFPLERWSALIALIRMGFTRFQGLGPWLWWSRPKDPFHSHCCQAFDSRTVTLSVITTWLQWLGFESRYLTCSPTKPPLWTCISLFIFSSMGLRNSSLEISLYLNLVLENYLDFYIFFLKI